MKSERGGSPCLRSDLPISPDLVDRTLDTLLGILPSSRGRLSQQAVEDKLRHAAYHESGHAVGAVHAYGPERVEFATIEPDAERAHDIEGFVRVRMLEGMGLAVLQDWQRKEELRAHELHCYAGVAAQYPDLDLEELDFVDLSGREDDQAFEDDETFGPIWEGSAGDRAGLAEYAAKLGYERPTNRWHMPSWNRARRFVGERWLAIEAVAAALLMRGTLSGEEVERIVGAVLA
jgi:hypothetical protein